ncbi:MAG: hypothetical protein FJ011_13965 [Chloroflexi bacterium]|nr:hypothetical protein [Chloroflexota bacterium]
MRKAMWIAFVIVSVLLAGCGQAAQPTTSPETKLGTAFMLALPRIVVDVDQEGNPSVLGITAADIGMSPEGARLPKTAVDALLKGNVQHIELRQAGHGVVWLVNGKPMPHLGWNDESLEYMSDLAALLSPANAQTILTVKKFVPIVRRLGLDIVLQFPKKAGVAAIPLADPNAVIKLAPVASTEPAIAIAKFEVKYDAKGVPGILGITTEDLASLGLNVPGNLSPDLLKSLQTANIQHLELRGRPDGLYVYVNSKVVPNIIWDQQFLANATEFYVTVFAGDTFVELVKTVLPAAHRADIAILVHLPLASGASAIPVVRH